jgi:methyl-accepting chemotaxis protein
VATRTEELFRVHIDDVHRQTDRMFAILMAVQFVAGLLAALVISPRTWAGRVDGLHVHVLAALLIGGTISSLPIFLAFKAPGAPITRHVMAAAQGLWSALIIHLMGGRIEAHFHVFGSLAIVAFYRDWRALLTITIVVAGDHLLRGALWSFSTYGVDGAPFWRAFEHAGWVVFEDVFLFMSCVRGEREVRDIAARRAELELQNRELVAPLLESARLLGDSAQELSASNAEQRRMVTAQATALQQTQTTAEEIRQTSALAAQKSEAVLRTAERAEEISRSGERAVEESLSGLADIREQVEQISAKISALNERTRQISGITETVKDLADQSNLLALNAAIEAARSGEHGRGFAVVAREIRSLADQSIQATARVREILEDIGGAIRAAVQITEQGKQRMEAGVVEMRTSGEKLRDLSTIVTTTSSAVRQIAAAVGQQNVGISQVFAAVTQQTRMMDETLQRLDATGQATLALQDLSKRVATVVERSGLEQAPPG